MNLEPRPPRLAEWLLKRVVPPRIAGESMLGDLRESFHATSQSRGRFVARAYYWIDVLRIAAHRPRPTRRVQLTRTTGGTVRRLGSLVPDAKLALRMLVKSPLLTVVGGLGIAVGIAVATLFFTFLTFYYSEPPVEDGDRVVTVEYVDEHGSRSTLVEYELWKDEVESLQELAAYRTVERDVESSIHRADPDEVAEMTASGFRVARVPPVLGRPLLDSDELGGAPPVLVIGYREWQERFGGDPAVVGREVRVSGIPHLVVGVMPDDFRLPVNHGFWTALATGPGAGRRAAGADIHIFGRLAPGVEPAAAEAEVAAIGQRTLAETRQVSQRFRAVVAPYVRHIMDLQRASAWEVWLISLFGWLILTVVAVNVAVLFYARTALRRAEITVRTALGASRSRIVAQLFVEALALATVAAAVGLLMAHVGFQQAMLVRGGIQDELPDWLSGGLPPETIVYAAGLAAFTALVVGVLPALQATGRRLHSTLREIGGGTGLRLGRTWTVLICLQVAVAVGVLPAVVGIAWYYTPPPTPTFAVSELLSFRLLPPSPLPGAAESDRRAADAAYGSSQAELLRRVEAIPDVAGVTYTSFGSGVRIEAEDPADANDATSSGSLRVDIRYFGVFGVPLLAGRSFNRTDAVEGAAATIVNRAFVDEYFAGGSALGRRFREVPLAAAATYTQGGQSFVVVGVVENMFRPQDPYVYHPAALGTQPLRLFARTRGIGAASVVPRVREIATQIMPGAELDAGSMDSFYALDSVALRLHLLMPGLATLSVLLLSAGGISAMMSFAVTQRQREVGIRTALGASQRQVMASIFWRSIRQLGIGLLFGVVAAVVLDRLTSREYLGNEAISLLAIVVAIVFVSGLLVTLGPARRALRIEPTEAMRAE